MWGNVRQRQAASGIRSNCSFFPGESRLLSLDQLDEFLNRSRLPYKTIIDAMRIINPTLRGFGVALKSYTCTWCLSLVPRVRRRVRIACMCIPLFWACGSPGPALISRPLMLSKLRTVANPYPYIQSSKAESIFRLIKSVTEHEGISDDARAFRSAARSSHPLLSGSFPSESVQPSPWGRSLRSR